MPIRNKRTWKLLAPGGFHAEKENAKNHLSALKRVLLRSLSICSSFSHFHQVVGGSCCFNTYCCCLWESKESLGGQKGAWEPRGLMQHALLPRHTFCALTSYTWENQLGKKSLLPTVLSLYYITILIYKHKQSILHLNKENGWEEYGGGSVLLHK